jgi:AcrR family transcriptional regulator
MPSEAGGRRPPGRPAQLSRERIVAAVASAGNVDTLTMREIAARLGVQHGALYRWVKNRDDLFDLVGAELLDRILPPDEVPLPDWRAQLALVAWRMHDQYLAIPGYATHLSRPHPHNAHSVGRLHDAITAAFAAAGAGPELTEQSYYIFMTSVVSWLALQENPLHLGPAAPRFDLFLDTLLRGLPAREPASPRP